jgi:hypothetical protein
MYLLLYLYCFSVMSICMIYKCFIWDCNQQQDLTKTSQAQMLSVQSHMVSQKTQSALRKEQG